MIKAMLDGEKEVELESLMEKKIKINFGLKLEKQVSGILENVEEHELLGDYAKISGKDHCLRLSECNTPINVYLVK